MIIVVHEEHVYKTYVLIMYVMLVMRTLLKIYLYQQNLDLPPAQFLYN